MFKKYITLILFISLFFVSSEVSAQIPCPDPSPSGPCSPPGFPIDGGAGIAILLAAGVAFGIKKLRE